VGEQMKQLMGAEIGPFSTCAMEKRPDPQYDFNNPLLEDLLEQWMEAGVQEVVLSPFFLLPGRHAGTGGDLDQICQPFLDQGMKIGRTENLGSHPLVQEILLDRIRADQNN
jgi:sirohydrochlorin ferrochelatase